MEELNNKYPFLDTGKYLKLETYFQIHLRDGES